MASFTDEDFRRKWRRVAELEGLLAVTRDDPALTTRDFRRKWREVAGLNGLLTPLRLGPALTDEDFRRKWFEAAVFFGLIGGFAPLSHSVEFADSALTADDGFLRATTGEALGVTNTVTLAGWMKQTSLASTSRRLFFGIIEDDALPYNNAIIFNSDTLTYRAFVQADDNLSDGDPSAGGAPNRFEQHPDTGWVVNTWHLGAVTYDQGASQLRYFLDGVELLQTFGSGAFPVLNDAADRTVFMGGDVLNPGRSFPGRIAALGVWDSVMTAAELVALYELGAPDNTRDWRVDFGAYVSGSNLRHYYRGTSATLSDLTTDIIGTNNLDAADATDGPTDANMILDAP